MATKLYLRDSKSNAIGVYRDMAVVAGAAAVTGVANTTAGGTLIQWTRTAGGEAITFITAASPAAGWTLDGDVTFSIWAKESNVDANCGIKCRLWIRTAAGVETEIDTGWSYGAPDEITASDAEYSWTGNPTSTAFAEGDRLVLRVYVINVGTMIASRTGTMTFGAADAATGDSFISLTETVDFTTDARIAQIPRTVWYLPNTQEARIAQIPRTVWYLPNTQEARIAQISRTVWISEIRPESWIPPGQAKPPKPEPPGPGNKPPRENQRDIREYRWRYLRNDTQGRYVAESEAFDVFDAPEVEQAVGSTFGETPSGILRGIQRGMMRMLR